VAVPLPMEAARQWAAPAFLASLTAGLAVFAMLFAVLGVYGVTSFSLGQRDREIAIRASLGATHGRVIRMILREGAGVLGAGLVVGLGAAALVGRGLSAQLYGVGAFDPLAIGTAVAMLAAAVLAASWWPAARAARRSPARALNEG
jgi:ABC-type antimicrobial peptide transport system permease subunit